MANRKKEGTNRIRNKKIPTNVMTDSNILIQVVALK